MRGVQIRYFNNLDWSLGYALLEVFPIRPAVLPFQGVGTERHGLKGWKLTQVRNLSGIDIGAERKWNPRWGVVNNNKLILRTNGRTVRWDKYRDYQFIDCTGIRRKEDRNYIRAHLRNRRTYLLLLRENAISSKEKGREYRYSGIGADQPVVVSCVDLRLWKLSHSEGADGFEVMLPSTCICNVTMSVCLPVNLKWLREFEEPYDGRLSRTVLWEA